MAMNLEKMDFSRNDPRNMISRIENFPQLCLKAWEECKSFILPSYYIKTKKFVILGMGGSGISGDIVKDLFSDLPIVIESVHNYDVPNWVDEETLVIACSYSGNTEETLAALIEAQNKKAKLAAVSTGGKLKVLCDKYNIPLFNFDFDSEPRAAFPYLFMSLLSIFVKLGHFEMSDKELNQAIEFTEKYRDEFKRDNKTNSNLAKMIAKKIYGKTPIIYSSGKLSSVGRRFKTQINENAKNFAFNETFPELNHNTIVGLNHPKNNHILIMIESNYDNPRIIKRQNITLQILQKNKIPVETIKFLPCESQLAEILTIVLFGDFVSYYLGILNNENIDQNKNIDYLKSELEN